MHIYGYMYNTYPFIHSARYRSSHSVKLVVNSFGAQHYRLLQRLFPSYEVEYDRGTTKHAYLKNVYDAKI